MDDSEQRGNVRFERSVAVRSQQFHLTGKLKLPAADGKKYLTDVATAETLLSSLTLGSNLHNQLKNKEYLGQRFIFLCLSFSWVLYLKYVHLFRKYIEQSRR